MDILRTILYYLYVFLNIYYYIIIITIILSWTPVVKTQVYYYLKIITDPFLNVFRGFLVISVLDLTPLIGLILYQLLLQLMARFI